MPPRNLADWVALSLVPDWGPVRIRRLLSHFGEPGAVAYRLPASALRSVQGIGDGHVASILAARAGLRERAEEEIRRSERLGVRLLTPIDDDYPAAFEGLPDAPILLYIKGRLAEATVRASVVGSRRATAYGRRVATGLAAGLALRGIEVVSGGARGIDTCAHLGALETEGRTVAVLGSGFLHPYPAENAELFERIAASGALISEFSLEIGPKPENFPRRNRLIAGLSAVVVVVEAAARSGSLITAGHALDMGREVMAVPGPVSSDQSEGCHRLIQQGAKLVHKVEDILEELSPMYTAALRTPEPCPNGEKALNFDELTDDERALLMILDDPEPVQLDALAERAPFGIARLQTALFGLEVRGAVEQLPGRYYLGRPRKES